MEATAAKWIAITVLGLGSFLLGMIPVKISSTLKWTRHGCQRSPASQLAISLMLCFGAGVLLATSLTHMLPEVRENIELLMQLPDASPFLQSLPLTETLLAMGFFLVYGLDELVHMALYRSQHSHQEHTHNEEQNGNDMQGSHGHGHSHDPAKPSSLGHGHSHCPPTTLTEQEPRPGTRNSLLRQSSGQHHYGATECHNVHPSTSQTSEKTPLIMDSDYVDSTSSVTKMSITSGLLALVALSIHAVTEGLAIGLQNSPGNVFVLLGAVATHKFVIAFCLGMEMAAGWGMSRSGLRFHILFMTVFSGMSALGILIGLLLSSDEPEGLFLEALQALAAGTLLYVTFCEVLPRERAKCHAGGLQFLAVFAGFIVMLTLDSVVPHGDENPGGGSFNLTTTIPS